jgi:hypothetical protein
MACSSCSDKFTELCPIYVDFASPMLTHAGHLAGTWSAEQAAAFEEAVAGFEKVDEKMWG